MYVVFGTVLDIAAIVVGNLLRSEGREADVSRDTVKLRRLVCEGLEERSATRTRSAENH